MAMPRLPTLRTARLELIPLTAAAVHALLVGEDAGFPVAEGYPHPDSYEALRMAASAPGGGTDAGWFIALRETGAVIGDCGTKGWVDDRGCVEIGYGLAAPSRGRGFGTEAVAAFTDWLLEQPGVRAVVAEVEVGNLASRRLLERVGFQHTGDARGCWWFTRPVTAASADRNQGLDR